MQPMKLQGFSVLAAITAAFLLPFAACADTFWKGQGTDSDFYNRDNWKNWWNNNYVFGGGELGILPADGSYVTFTNAAAIPQGLWIENAGKGGVEWSLAENAEEGAGLTITNSLTVGTGRAGQLAIKGGEYLVRDTLKVATGLGTTDGGPGLSTLTLTNCTLTANKVLVATADANGANGAVVVNAGAVLNSLATSGDVFAICQGKSGHTDTTGSLTINGGTVNVASDLYTCQDSGTGTITINSGELNVAKSSIISRGWSTASSSTLNMNGGKYWTGNAFELAAAANRTASEGTLNMKGGWLAVGSHMYLGGSGGGASRATVNMDGGEMSVTNHMHIADGSGSVVNFYMNGGELVCKNQFWLGNGTGSVGTFIMTNGMVKVSSYTCVGYGSGGTGHFIMNGGTYTQTGEKFIVGQANGSEGTYGECIVSNGTITVPTLWIAENKKPGILKMAGGTFNVTGEAQLSRNSGASEGRIELNGGTLSVNYFSSSSGTGGEIIFNGGTLAARVSRENFIPDIANLKLTIAEGGAVIDTDGHSVTIADTFENADGLAGNGMIWKKGLGTLTISSDLDLERTFKFTIHDGVGPVALTGEGNTLGEGAKITVLVDPSAAEIDTPYTLMTGLGELTADDIEITGDDFYTYTPAVSEGTLTVTLAVSASAAVTARYVNGEWGFYDAEGNFIENGSASGLTSYVFNGSEPFSELATLADAGRTIILEAVKDGDNGVTNTIALTSDLAATRVVVSTEEGCAVALSGDDVALTIADIVNDGTIVFDGEITLGATLAGGNVVIADGAVVHLVKTQSIKALLSGSGEVSVENAELTVQNDSVDNGLRFFRNFTGTLTVGEGAILHDLTDLHAENVSQGYYFLGEHSTLKMAGGRISRFGGATNNEYINNVVIAEGTTNVWNNYQSRSGWTGCNVFIKGTFTGTGMLQANISGRSYRFSDGLSGFGGIVEMSGSAFQFDAGINGGTWIANTNAVLIGWNGSARVPIAVDNATLVLKGGHGAVSGVSAGTFTIGANAALKVGESAAVEGISFAAGAVLELLDDGALSDRTQTYVALTSATPFGETLPTLVQPVNSRGKWKLVQKTVPGEGEDPDTYQLVAEFRPSGFMIIIQ